MTKREPAERGRSNDTRAPAPPSPPRSQRASRVLWTMLVLVAAAGTITARVVISGEAEIQASNEALDRGDAHDATIHARRAAGWYVPAAPHVTVGYQRLIALAEGAEAHRRNDLALLAWRGVRSASLETRWLLTPHHQEAARAEREIARLAATSSDGLKVDQAEMQAQLRALSRRPGPSQTWSAVLVGAFAFAAVGLFWSTRSLAAAAGQLEWKRARPALLLTAAAALMWLLAMWRA